MCVSDDTAVPDGDSTPWSGDARVISDNWTVWVLVPRPPEVLGVIKAESVVGSGDLPPFYVPLKVRGLGPLPPQDRAAPKVA